MKLISIHVLCVSMMSILFNLLAFSNSSQAEINESTTSTDEPIILDGTSALNKKTYLDQPRNEPIDKEVTLSENASVISLASFVKESLIKMNFPSSKIILGLSDKYDIMLKKVEGLPPDSNVYNFDYGQRRFSIGLLQTNNSDHPVLALRANDVSLQQLILGAEKTPLGRVILISYNAMKGDYQGLTSQVHNLFISIKNSLLDREKMLYEIGQQLR